MEYDGSQVIDGVYRGREEVRRAFADVVGTALELRHTELRFREQGDQVAVATKVLGRGAASGAAAEAGLGYLFTLRAGEVVRVEMFQRPDDALTALGGVDVGELKKRARAYWGLGDYSQIARALEPAAAALADACAVSAGQEVLDVAAGDGNFALAAAREGASVVASDISPAQVERGRARTEAEGYDVEWLEADAEELPFEDARFDCAASVFGAMFAPRPERAAREMFRVVRPGNTVGMANWAPDGFAAKLFEVGSRYVPPPEGVPLPVEWGVEETVRERFEVLAGTIEAERREHEFRFADRDEFWHVFGETAPPQVALREALSDEQWESVREEMLALLDEHNEADDGSVLVHSPYLLVVARRRG